MSIKQNLDSFFKEKLQNLESTPEASVWIEIEARLNQNKTKAVTSSNWLKYTAVAAVFMLSGLLGLNTKQSFKTARWVESKKRVAINKKYFNYNKLESDPTKLNQLKVVVQNTTSKPVLGPYNALKLSKQKSTIINSSILERRQSLSEINSSASSKLSSPSSSIVNQLIVTKINSKKQNTNAAQLLSIKNDSAQINHQQTSSNPNRLSLNSSTLNNQTQTSLDYNRDTNNKFVAKTEFEAATTITFNDVDSHRIPKNRSVFQNDSLQIKKSLIFITEAPVDGQKLESWGQPKKVKKNNVATSKWQITTTIAPIYFGSTSNGSPLDKKFIDNEKSFQVSQSYGLGINYAVSSKIKIRIGLHSINLDYDTKNIAYEINNSSGTKLTNVTANSFGRSVLIDNIKSSAIFGRTSNSAELLSDASSTGTLNQKIGYVELPIELSYKIGGSKFNIDLITGISTYYLQQNTILLKTATSNIEIGEASNLNRYHFSGNLGLGLNYRIIHNFSASVEPTFKYQVNTFANNAGNFKPYIFGIYSGVKYNF